MKRFEDAEIGDKVYSRIFGDGVVVEKDGGRGYIKVNFSLPVGKFFYLVDGRYFQPSDAEPTLFYRDGEERYLTERPKKEE